MRNDVTINGVTLSRAQIEQAVKMLNEPEHQKFEQGDIVSWVGQSGLFLVLERDISIRLSQSHKTEIFPSTVRVTDGHFSYTPQRSVLTRVYSLSSLPYTVRS